MKPLLVVLLALSTQAFALEGSVLRDYHPLGKNPKLEPMVACKDSKNPSATNSETPLEQVCQTRLTKAEKKRAWADYLSNEITFFMRVK
jgi:hypothetical protein